MMLYWSIPVIVLLATIEGLVLSRTGQRDYDWGAYFASLGDLLGRTAIDIASLALLGAVYGWVWAHRVWTVPLSNASAFALLFLGQEFCYYWAHRSAHRMRWFWATHAVHHSPNQLNLSAAYRFGWTGRLSGSTVFYLPLIWLGFPPIAVFVTLTLNLLYQFLLHATWIPKLGWLEHVLNTPSHHRVHHAANLDYLDANYGGVLIIFDRLFGTLRVEREDLPCRYGLVTPLKARNTVAIAFHEWRALVSDLRQARSPREVWLTLFGPPGWRADGQGQTTEDLRRMAAAPAPGD